MEQIEDSFEDIVEDVSDGLQDALDRLREFRDSLLLDEFAPGTPVEKAGLAMQEFQDLLALALTGDVDAINALQAAAQDALRLGAAAFGTSTEQFAAIWDQIMEGLNAVLGLGEGGDGADLNTVVTSVHSLEDTVWDGLGQVKNTNESGFTNQIGLLRETVGELKRLNSRFQAPTV
jgi:hypothetical protein